MIKIKLDTASVDKNYTHTPLPLPSGNYIMIVELNKIMKGIDHPQPHLALQYNDHKIYHSMISTCHDISQ
jgi:hypothetical protein